MPSSRVPRRPSVRVVEEAELAVRATIAAGSAGPLIDRLLAADPLWFQRRGWLPRHVLLAVRCLSAVSLAEALTLRSRALADAVVGLLEVASVRPAEAHGGLAGAFAEEILPVFAWLGPQWAGRARYQDWYLTVGQHMPGYERTRSDDAVVVAARLFLALQPRDEQSIDRLRQQAVNGHRTEIRQAAIHTLVAARQDVPDTLPWLRRYVVAAGSDAGQWNDIIGRPDVAAQPPPELQWHSRIGADAHGRARRVAVELIDMCWPHADEPEIAGWLLDHVRTEPEAEVRAAAIKVVAARRAGDPRVRRRLLKIAGAGWRDFGVTRAAAIEGIAAGWPDHDDLLRSLYDWGAKAGDDHARPAAIHAIGVGWAGRPEPVAWLHDQATVPRRWHEEAQLAAIKVLAANWPEHPGTVPLLRRLSAPMPPPAQARTWDDREAQTVAIQALAVVAPREPETHDLLHQAVTDPSYQREARPAALRAIATEWADHPGTLALLHRLTTDGDLASEAVDLLVAGWADHPGTLPLLLQGANKTGHKGFAETLALATDWPEQPDALSGLHRIVAAGQVSGYRTVAAEALRAIAVGYADHPDTLPFLREHTRYPRRGPAQPAPLRKLWPWQENPPQPVPEYELAHLTEHGSWAATSDLIAIHAIATMWADHPETLPLLRDLATTVQAHDVRLAAVQAVAAGWADDPATAPLLRDRAANDRYWLIQAAAARALAARWTDDPATLPLLINLTADERVRVDMCRIMAEQWTDDPRIRQVLRDVARSDIGGYWRGRHNLPGS